jgi:hypothetical protein
MLVFRMEIAIPGDSDEDDVEFDFTRLPIRSKHVGGHSGGSNIRALPSVAARVIRGEHDNTMKTIL